MPASRRYFAVFVVIGWLCSPAHAITAEVLPGETIDKTSWGRISGLVPGPVLEWVKKGDFVLCIEELSFVPRDYFPSFALEAFESNAGVYELDEEGGIVEKSTGKPPVHIVGLPFPRIDPDDPGAPMKIMHDVLYMQYLPGNLKFPLQAVFIGRSGFEREVECLWQQMAMDGHPEVREMPNPNRIQKYAILLVQKPFDLAGTAIMLWRYLHPGVQDTTFGYVPAIRRVRRMSPAHRSDAFIGSDFSVDDVNGYDGKISAGEWRLLRTQEMIGPAFSKDPVRIERNEEGEWVSTKDIRPVTYGFQEEGWQGASWAPTNLVWLKRPAYVLEMTPKDPYYNYGRQEIWVDAEIFGCAYKVIHDKSGRYWKTFFSSGMVCSSADKHVRFISVATQQAVDDRTSHSSIIEGVSPRNRWHFGAKLDANDFSLAGFQKFCK